MTTRQEQREALAQDVLNATDITAKRAAFRAMNRHDRETREQKEATTMNTTSSKPRQITISTVKKAYQGSGGYFFDKQAMRFFDSRLANTAYKVNDTYIFVTSEQFHNGEYSGARLYTVRTWSKGQEYPSTVNDVGGFQAYATQAEALDAAKQYAEEVANR